MESLSILAALVLPGATPVITEVAANPLDETSGEFVELYNPGPDTIALSGFSLTDGDALDYMEPWNEASHGVFPHPGAVTGTDTLPPESWCLVFELDYADNPVYDIPDGTLIMTTADLSICNGLAASSDPLTLFDPLGTADSNAVSTYGTPFASDNWQDRDDDGCDTIPFDPGDGFTVERYPLSAPDQEGSWIKGPFGGSPGAPPEAPSDTVNVCCTGVWSDPDDPGGGQEFQLLCSFHCWGNVAPASGELSLFLDSRADSVPQAGELLCQWPASQLIPGQADTFSVDITLDTGWYIPSALADIPEDGFEYDDYCRIPLAVGGGVPAVVTEVIANAENEDTDELVEIFYPGPGALLLDGCHITDGDALDQLQLWDQGPLIDPDALMLSGLPAGCVAVVLDSEYGTGGQPYDLPESTAVLTTGNTTLGNGLTTNDPVLLYHHADSSLSSLMSTYGTPILSDDPLQCDDDGSDGIPFDPGDGAGVQRISPLLPDLEWAWESSGTGGTPGYVPQPPDSQDLALVRLTLTPQEPLPGQQLSLCALVLNSGLEPLSDGSVVFFLDQDADSLPSESEILAEEALPLLQPGDTAAVQTTTALAQGNYLAAALCCHPEDGCAANDLRRQGLVVGAGSPLVVSEVVCNPEDEDRDELVELHFPGPGVFSLEGCRITDGDALDSLVPLPPGSLEDPDAVYGGYLPAGGFALVLDSEYSDGAQPYDLPSATLVMTTANTTIGDGLSGSDPISLYGPGGTTADHVMSTYGTPLDSDDPQGRDDDGLDGIPFDPGESNSVQRLDLTGADIEENWYASPQGPTPGGPPPEVFQGPDACLPVLALEPPMGEGGDQVGIAASVMNVGTDPIPSAGLTLRFYRDADGDSLADPSEEIFSYQTGSMDPGDSLIIPAQWTSCSEPALLMAVANCPDDSNPANDTVSTLWNRPLDLVLNEIMYSPSSGRPEWVELHCRPETGPVDLSCVRFSDSKESTALTEGSLLLHSGEYAVLCSDSAAFVQAWPEVDAPILQPEEWPVLNNSNQQGRDWADDLRLFLDNGQVLDWVPYGDDWGGSQGVSLERIQPSEPGYAASNWTGCPQGGTPGAANSCSGGEAGSPFLEVWPSPFSPDGDGRDDILNIEMHVTEPDNTVTARVYNVQGRIVRTLADRMASGGSLQLQWDGTDQWGAAMPVGRYLVFLSCRPASGELREAVKVVILARRL